jgi:hypothetical protein
MKDNLMARAGPIVRGPARFGSYRKPLLVFPYLPPSSMARFGLGSYGGCHKLSFEYPIIFRTP